MGEITTTKTCDTDMWLFVNQIIFLMVNHRGPLPLRELHSTGETIVWRDPGGSWACLWPVYYYGWNHHHQNLWHRHVAFCKSDRFSYGESPRTPPLEGTSLHRRNNSVERPWGILSLFMTCLLLWVKPPPPKPVTQTCGFCKSDHFLRWITADPSPWGNFTPPTKQ